MVEVAGGIRLGRPSTGFARELSIEVEPLAERLRDHPYVLDVWKGKASSKLVQGFGREFLPIVRGTYRRMSMRLQHAAAHDHELQTALIKEVAEEILKNAKNK